MRRNKFNAVKTKVDGITFDSKKEARRYGELRILESAGEIWDLNVHPRIPIFVNGELICNYVADFSYRGDAGGLTQYEDVKGGKATKTGVYRLKKALVEAIYKIKIKEV